VYLQCIYMKAVLQKWGNSLALRIPRTVAAEIAVGEGHSVDLQVNKGRLVVAPLAKKRYELADLVSQISAKNRHEEMGSGKPRGAESW
jgi:antitoxin MazE